VPRHLLVALSLTVLLGEVRAQEPLPPPRPVPGTVVVAPPVFAPPPYYYRPNPSYAWRNYAVDQRGFFRPRVVVTAEYGPIYAATGKPYPWLYENERLVQNRVQGVPYRSYMPYARD